MDQIFTRPRGVLFVGSLFCIAFWLGAVAFGFPRTYWDDSLIVGPAINIADTGKLVNIYLSKNFYPGDHYLFYPPIFFWILGGWIVAFGREVVSLNLFWAICAVVASFALTILLKRLTRAKLLPWLVAPFLLFGCIAYTGFRFEVLALATLLTGIALSVHGRRLTGYFMLFLTPTIAPTFLGVSAIVALSAFLVAAQGRILRESLYAAAMLLTVCLILIASVSGQIVDLIATMYNYRDVRIALGGRDLDVTTTSTIPIGLNLVSGAIQYFGLKRPIKSIELFLPFLIIISFEITLITHARPITLVVLNIATLLVAAATFGALLEKLLNRPEAKAGSLLVACVGCFLAALNLTYLRDVALSPLSASLIADAQRAAAAAPPGHILVADPQILKDALGYPTGQRIEDSMVRKAMPAIFQNYRDIPPNEYLVITRSTLLSGTIAGYQRPYRNLIDQMLIATGMQASAIESICVIDQATARQWNGHNPEELAEIACKPRYSFR